MRHVRGRKCLPDSHQVHECLIVFFHQLVGLFRVTRLTESALLRVEAKVVQHAQLQRLMRAPTVSMTWSGTTAGLRQRTSSTAALYSLNDLSFFSNLTKDLMVSFISGSSMRLKMAPQTLAGATCTVEASGVMNASA